MRYEEYPPHADLASHIRCYWVFEHQFEKGEVRDDRIVPDGSPELIFHFGDPYAEPGEDQLFRHQPLSLFAGQITRPLLLRSAGHAGVIGIRFQPWGAHRFIAMPMHEAVDRRIDLADLGEPWRARLAALQASMRQADGDEARIGAIEGVLLNIAANNQPDDDAIARCVDELRAALTGIEVGKEAGNTMQRLREISGLGERQLERRFRDVVGLSPKMLAAILRFRALFDAFEASSNAPWLRAAIDTGYFDQAHMIRDFKRFAGRPPQAFYQSLAGLSASMVGNAPVPGGVGFVQDDRAPGL